LGLLLVAWQRPPLVVFPLLALLGGLLPGLAFAAAVAARGGERAAGLLYGVDLAGGSLGALLGAGLLVPLLGLPGTCAVAALLGAAALLAVV
jgi:spermidine synthase